MSYSPTLGSVFNRTKMRDPSHVCSFSGMCAMCTADCIGSCEIGLSAVRGMETVYPTTTGENQIASEKVYPVDYSHFNINGRSFGAMGAPLDADRATIYHVGLEREIGTLNPVKLRCRSSCPRSSSSTGPTTSAARPWRASTRSSAKGP